MVIPKWFGFLLIILVFFTLVACGSNEAQPEPTLADVPSSTPVPVPTNTPEPTHISSPTDTPLPTPTSTPIPTAIIAPTPTPQAGEERINPETGQEEVFSNTYGWVGSHELGTLIEEDGVVKVMTEQGLLPFSEQIVDRLESDQVDIETAEVIVADMFVQIGNILAQADSKADQVIYGKDSQIFGFDEKLATTINDALVIMSKNGTGKLVWDTEAKEWTDSITDSLVNVAPNTVQVNEDNAYDASGNIIAKKITMLYPGDLKNDDESGGPYEVWVRFVEGGKTEAIQLAQDFYDGKLQISSDVKFRAAGSAGVILNSDYWVDNGVIVTEEIGLEQHTETMTPVLLGVYTDENTSELMMLVGGEFSHGKELWLLSLGYLHIPGYESISRTSYKTVDGHKPPVNPGGKWKGEKSNISLFEHLQNAIGRPVMLRMASFQFQEGFGWDGGDVTSVINAGEHDFKYRHGDPQLVNELRKEFHGENTRASFVFSPGRDGDVTNWIETLTGDETPYVIQMVVPMPEN